MLFGKNRRNEFILTMEVKIPCSPINQFFQERTDISTPSGESLSFSHPNIQGCKPI